MFCPNYKDINVFNNFNKMIEVLGGRPMTEDEFKSAELRKQRSGRDFDAMNLAYAAYHRNGGNFMDKTPDGKDSLLFQTLEDYFGKGSDDAIRQKLLVYSDAFMSWFGDWTSDDKTNVSKVVDENGEPLVVWHGTNKKFEEFKGKYARDFVNYDGEDYKLTYGGFFFTSDKWYSYAYGNIHVPVYLNIKEDLSSYVPFMVPNNPFNGDSYVDNYNELTGKGYISIDSALSAEMAPKFDIDQVYGINPNNYGIIGKDIGEESEDRWEYVVYVANQIKHIENLGAFDPKTDNIYHVETPIRKKENNRLVNSVSVTDFLTQNGYIYLTQGEKLSSKTILQNLIQQGMVESYTKFLADILSQHDIPVIHKELSVGKPMSTVVDKDGKSVIVIDINQLGNYSASEASNLLMHEIIHAVSVKALRRPENSLELAFSKANKELYNIFDEALPESEWGRSGLNGGLYILRDPYEFAAVFATDRDAKAFLYQKAIEIDRNKKGVLQALKRFVNALSRLLLNKNIFKATVDKFNSYEKQLNYYLTHIQPVVNGNIKSADEYKRIYESITNESLNRKAIANTQRMLNEEYSGFMWHFAETKIPEDVPARMDKIREFVADALQTRLMAIKASSIADETKISAQQIVESQMAQFRNKNINGVVALSSFLQQVIPQLLEDVDAIRNLKETDNGFYMYHRHDNFGAYKAILDALDRAMKDPSFREEIEQGFKTISKLDKMSAIKDLKSMRSMIHNAASVAQEGVDYMYYILMNNVKRDLGKISEDVHLPSTKRFLDSLEEIGFDSNVFMQTLGAKDGAKDDAVRSLVYLVNKAIRNADEQAYDRGVDLLKAKDNLKFGESELMLYELDKNGQTTGYLVRDLNFGEFYNDYTKFLSSLNKKYGLEESNRIAPDGEHHIAWNKARNKWLAEHCNRRFTEEYYNAYAELSDDTLKQMDVIRGAISALKQKALGEDGYYHFDKLSPDEWRRLQGLYIEKRLLGSDYNINGELKIEGTDEYRWAKEIQKLNETLYKDKQELKRATEAWQKARNEYIKKITEESTDENGDISYMKIRRLLEEWDLRNSKRKLKVDDEGNALVYKQIDDYVYQLSGGKAVKPIYDYNGDGGATYEENKKRINEILSIFKDYNTGEVNLDILPARVKAIVRNLQKENKKIYNAATSKNKNLLKDASTYGKYYRKAFNKYLKVEPTSYYNRSMDDEIGESLSIVSEMDVDDLPRWATKIVVKKSKDDDGIPFFDKFTELIPGDGWINTDNNNKHVNKDFDESYGVSMVPKKELYSNKEAFDKINNSPTLKALYDIVHQTIHESNQLQYNRQFTDDYLLPQITGSMWKYMKAKGIKSASGASMDYVRDKFGLSKQGIEQDTDFGKQVTDILLNATELGEMVKSESVNYNGHTTGVRPDGRQFNVIPIYYTKKLDDPSQISSDLIGMVQEYYNNSLKFKNKSEIRDTAESIMDVIENRNYNIKNRRTGNVEKIQGNKSRTYQVAKKFLEMNLYNIRSDSKTIQLGQTQLNLNKVGQQFSRLTTALNLGCSPAVAATGFLTASYAHLINGITGDRGYGSREVFAAGKEVLSHMLRNFGGASYVGNQMSKDKLMVLAEYFNIANQSERKFKHSNRNRIVRALDNWCYGMLTGLDFVIKSNIMVSNLMSHRLVDGVFVSKEDIRNRLENASTEKLAEALKKWNEGVCLYSILDVKDGKISIAEEYKDAFNRSKDKVYFRITKSAENADGMATETQKAAITTNFLGAAVLTHRQYLPLMLQQRVGDTVYDMDTQLYGQGQYRTILSVLKFLVNGYKDARKANSINAGIQRIKDDYQLFFNNTSTEESWGLSRARKMHLKKTAAELVLFNLFVSPLIGLLCTFADDDDKRDEQLLQLTAYIARRTEWEVYTPYRFDDILNNIKSVSAQTGTLDKVDALKNSVGRHIFPQGSLLDTFLDLDNKQRTDDIISTGVYKDWSRFDRDMFKFMPVHNFYEQWNGSKTKRKYYENQIMQLHK